MPHVAGKFLTPDEALKKGLCPECGCDLSTKDPHGHALYHYPQTIDDDPHYEEARRRKALIENYKPAGG